MTTQSDLLTEVNTKLSAIAGTIANTGLNPNLLNLLELKKLSIDPSTDPSLITGKYDTPWTDIETYTTTPPDAVNSVPVDGDFVPIDLAEGIKSIEVRVKDLVITNAPSSVVIAVWVKVGTDAPYLLGTYGATVGENRATVIGGNGFKALTPVLMDAFQKASDIKVACKVIVDATRITYSIDSNAKAATQTTALGANTGFLNTLCTTNSNSAGSPSGIGGNLTFYDISNNAVTVTGASFIANESLRLPWGSTFATYFPPLGLSGKIVCSDINRSTNTITITGAQIDFRLQCYRTVRLRLSSIFSAISVFPSVDNAVLNNTTSYILTNVSGSVGNQTAQLTTTGGTALTFTSQGAGWIYVFPYRDIDGVTISSGRLTIDGNVISYTPDWNGTPVTVTSGTASVISHTNSYANGDELTILGSAAPAPLSLGDKVYVISRTGTNYKISATVGGLPLALTSTGTTVAVQRTGDSTINGVTVATGTPSVISFGASATTLRPHWMGALQRITLGGGTRPANGVYTYTSLWLSATSLTATAFQVVQMVGMPSVAFEDTGTSVTLTALLRYGNMLVERATVTVGASGDTDSSFTIMDSTGGALNITGLSTAVTTIAPVNAPVITSGSIQVRAIGGV
jgi:hypothetical protein